MRIVDLTHILSEDMPLYPSIPRPSFQDIATVETDGYGMSEFRFWNHIGTHIDAPSHHVIGPTLDQIPPERLITHALVLDFTQHPKGLIGIESIEPHLRKIEPGSFVLINSGNSVRWGTEAYWTGWCYPDEEAARALIARGISGIGFDGPSADRVNLESFPLHKVWLGAHRLILENVANLNQVPERFLLVIAPLHVRGANGAPTRLFALLSEQKGTETYGIA